MTKKILLIIGIITILGIALFLALNEQKARNDGGVGFSFRNYIPFGNNETNNTEEVMPEKKDRVPVEYTENDPIPKLRKISKEPVAGSVLWSVGTTTFVRFVEKGTGNVFEAKSNNLQVERITNTTLPKIIKAFWLKNASGFFFQTLSLENEIVETNFVSLVKKELSEEETFTPYNTKISQLPLGIKDLIVDKNDRNVLYYTIENNRSNFYTSKLDGSGSKKVFSHPLTEWSFRYWVDDNSVLIQTKAGGGIPTYSYTLNISKKEMKKTSNPIMGIANKTWIEKCYMPVKNSFVYCSFPNNIITMDIKDNWYKGKIFTKDYIAKTDIINDSYYNILDPKIEAGEDMDITNLMVSEDESHLIFKNKVDGSLWMFRIVD